MEILLKVAKIAGSSPSSFDIKGLLGILFAIFAFGFLIFIHELGHFFVAKKLGIRVNEFAIGMGPQIFKTTKGETTYSLRLLPIGGFVSLEGEDENSNDSRSFKNASIIKRAMVMTSGALMNILLGFILVLTLTYVQSSYPNAAFVTTTIDKFEDNATTNEWFSVGDKIISLNGKKIKNYSDFIFYLNRDTDGIIDIVVERSGENLSLEGVKFKQEEIAEGLSINVVDFIPKGEPANIFNTFEQSLIRTKDLSRQIWISLLDLITGNVSIRHMSGPIGITKQIGEVSSSGNWTYTILFVSLISLNLGILNLLPLPILDGGKLFLLLIEAIRKKPLDEKYEIYINLFGFVFLFMLMIVVSFNDIMNLF